MKLLVYWFATGVLLIYLQYMHYTALYSVCLVVPTGLLYLLTLHVLACTCTCMHLPWPFCILVHSCRAPLRSLHLYILVLFVLRGLVSAKTLSRVTGRPLNLLSAISYVRPTSHLYRILRSSIRNHLVLANHNTVPVTAPL